MFVIDASKQRPPVLTTLKGTSSLLDNFVKFVIFRNERYGRIHLKIEIYQRRAHIDIFKAENLPPMDISGTSDPYVVITVEPKPRQKPPKMKSSIKDRNLSPVWNESFHIDLRDIDYSSRVIVTVFDHDSIGPDDFIGCTSWSFNEVKKSSVDGIYRLQNKQEGKVFNQLIKYSDEKYGQLIGLLEEQPGKEQTSGLHLDDFELIQTIGTGSFGQVFYAKQLSTENYVAFKCISKATIQSEADIDVINAEKGALKMTNQSPYIVRLLSSFQNEKYIFLVMEFLAGGDLFFHMMRSENECFPIEEVAFYSAQVASAIHFIHSKKIIYRDLKLDNIALTPDGYIKLIDFGM